MPSLQSLEGNANREKPYSARFVQLERRPTLKAATITSKGQVTIPKDIRDALGLRERDQVIFVLSEDRAIMRPVKTTALSRLRGIAKGRASYRGRDAEREAAREHVARHTTSIPGDETPQE